MAQGLAKGRDQIRPVPQSLPIRLRLSRFGVVLVMNSDPRPQKRFYEGMLLDKNIFIVSDFKKKFEEDTFLYSVNISDWQGNSKCLWYEVRGLPVNARVQCADAFFAAILLFCMKRNADCVFDIPISNSVASCAEDLVYIFSIQLGVTRRPSLNFKHIVRVRREGAGVVTGFSSGVDSWFTIQKNLLDAPNSSRRLTHLLVNDVGANGNFQKTQDVFQRASQAAKEYGLSLVRISSNMNEFLQMDFQQTHTVRNSSVAHLLTHIADIFLYSSADTYAECGVFPTFDMAYADVVILPLLSNDAMTLKSSGSAFTRAEKTQEILRIPGIQQKLDICVNHEHGGMTINCGFCWKCMRTELTLEAFGCLNEFSGVFDLKKYRAHRTRYIQDISISRKPTDRELFKIVRINRIIGPTFFYKLCGQARRFVKLVRKAFIFSRSMFKLFFIKNIILKREK